MAAPASSILVYGVCETTAPENQIGELKYKAILHHEAIPELSLSVFRTTECRNEEKERYLCAGFRHGEN